MKQYWRNAAGLMMVADVPDDCHPVAVTLNALCQCTDACRVDSIDMGAWSFTCDAGRTHDLPQKFVGDVDGDSLTVRTPGTIEAFEGRPAA